ncbi:MAG: hypothetical protein H6624_17835 [Bdellovibrionaceae bacterium]|nr:hypothetical protein [Bdellovibrionales bacterium]MCB9086206.1 hypothetical protein [Pseudobdellovibrionaceae bacterium]
MSSEEANTSRGPKRKLSRFLCREMLYDFVTNSLDDSRRKAVEDFLKQDFDTQQDLENLKEGIKYCSDLGETKISLPLMQEIRDYKGFWGRLKEGRLWSSWPDSIKWGIEAVAISAVAAIVAMVIPWKKVSQIFPKTDSQVVLVEVKKEDKEKDLHGEKVAGMADQGEGRVTPSLPPEVPKESQVVPLPDVKTEPGKPEPDKKPQTKPPDSAPPEAAATSAEKKPVEVQQESDDEEGEKPTNQDRKPLKGFVYRAFMSLEELDAKTSEIVGGIQALGGAKAGQVELGWRKPKGSYFHFSLPESNYEEMVKLLRNFGPVRIYKDPHWRVMPEGKIRFILWVEDSKKKPQ